MKHFLKVAAAAAPFLLPAAGLAALAPTGAAAQTATYGTSLTINAEADVAARCDARLNSATGTVLAIDFGTLSDTAPAAQVTAGAGSATYICNDRDGFTRTITSANGGWLTLGGTPTTDANRRIRYTMQHGGGAGLGFAETQLTARSDREHLQRRCGAARDDRLGHLPRQWRWNKHRDPHPVHHGLRG